MFDFQAVYPPGSSFGAEPLEELRSSVILFNELIEAHSLLLALITY